MTKVVARIVLKVSEESFLEEEDILHMLMQMISKKRLDPQWVFVKVSEIKVFPAAEETEPAATTNFLG